MKAARFAAVGIVAAAVLWIASGHLLPRDNAAGHAAIKPSEAQDAAVVPRRRRHRRRSSSTARL